MSLRASAISCRLTEPSPVRAQRCRASPLATTGTRIGARHRIAVVQEHCNLAHALAPEINCIGIVPVCQVRKMYERPYALQLDIQGWGRVRQKPGGWPSHWESVDRTASSRSSPVLADTAPC